MSISKIITGVGVTAAISIIGAVIYSKVKANERVEELPVENEENDDESVSDKQEDTETAKGKVINVVKKVGCYVVTGSVVGVITLPIATEIAYRAVNNRLAS